MKKLFLTIGVFIFSLNVCSQKLIDLKKLVGYWEPDKHSSQLVMWFDKHDYFQVVKFDTVDGEPLDVILNPHGIASRINPSQLYEAALGKIAKKNNTRYLIENFSKDNNWDFIKEELKKHKMEPNEVVIDPNTKKQLKAWNPVSKKYEHPFVGVGYINKSVQICRFLHYPHTQMKHLHLSKLLLRKFCQVAEHNVRKTLLLWHLYAHLQSKLFS